MLRYGLSGSECTKIAHRRSLAIFTADEGIAGNSAARIIFTLLHRRKNRGSLAILFAEEIAHLGASKSRAIFLGAVKIAAATAENRAILVHSGQGYLRFFWEGRKVPTKSLFEQEAPKIGTQKCSTKRGVREPLNAESALNDRELVTTKVFEKRLSEQTAH